MTKHRIGGLGVAMVSVSATVLAAGPSALWSASAATQQWCTVNSTPNACPSGDTYGIDLNSADTLSLVSTWQNPTFSTPSGNIVCTDSTAVLESNSDTTNGRLTTLEFDGGTPGSTCSSTITFNPTATITANTTNTTVSLSLGAACVGGKTGCDATVSFNGLNIAIKLSGGSTCTVTGSVTGNFYNKGNPNAPHGGANAAYSEIDFPDMSITMSGSFPCSSSGTFTATYYVEANNVQGGVIYLTP